jgi:hypothetical protein
MSSNGSNGTIELSTGVVLRSKPVSRNIFADILSEHVAPRIPSVYNTDKGREEDNPQDPEYLADMQRYNTQLARAMSDALIVLGTEFESKPDELPSFDDETWLEEVDLLRVYKTKTRIGRYLAWVKTVAIATDEDFAAISNSVKRAMGVPEEDVTAQAKRFRPDKARSGVGGAETG